MNMSNIDQFYQSALREIMSAKPEKNLRTGEFVRAVPGMTFRTDLETEGFPLLSLRKMPMAFCAEQVWFMSGSNNIKWLSKHTKIWDAFAEVDGTVTSAYGYRWRNAMAIAQQESGNRKLLCFDQLENVLTKLRKDPSSRHGVIMMWEPFSDLLTKQKNVPCPYTFTLMIIDGRLHLHLTVRSNDMMLGFPTDVAGFALLQHAIAQELRVEVGIYTHSISNAHIYSSHEWAAEALLKRTGQKEKVVFEPPAEMLKRSRFEKNNLACFEQSSGELHSREEIADLLVSEIKKAFYWYTPHPAITGMKIAL